MDYSTGYQLLTRAYALPGRLLRGWSLPPLQVFIEVTYQCNLRCDFCQFGVSAGAAGGSRAAGGERPAELADGEIERLVGVLPPTTIVSFSGGEPLVRPGFPEVLARLSRRRKTHIYTNGTRIDDGLAGRLAALGARHWTAAGLVLVGVSLEGPRAVHNRITQRSWAFDRTVGGVAAVLEQRRRRRKRFPLVELKTVISRDNVGELYATYQLARELGVDIFNIMAINLLPHTARFHQAPPPSPLVPPPTVASVDPQLLREQLQRIEAAAREAGSPQLRATPFGFDCAELVNYYHGGRPLRDYRCRYPWFGLGISAYGDLSICPYAVLGNIRENGLYRLYNSVRARTFRRALATAKLFPGCWGCCMLVPARPRAAGAAPGEHAS